jgi:hypothetical protein
MIPKKLGSKLGQKLREIRQEIIASGIPLLTAEEADKEKVERRGGYGENLIQFLLLYNLKTRI